MSTVRPTVGAYLAPGLQSVQFIVDGRNLTSDATQDSSRWSWAPSYDLDRGRHTAVVQGRTQGGQEVSRSWIFVIAEASTLEVVSVTPNGEQAIGATFSGPLQKARLYLDGQPVHGQLTQNKILYQPPRPLPNGRHKAAVRAMGLDGSVVEKSWTFQVGGKTSPTATRPPRLPIYAARSPLPGQFTDTRPAIRLQFVEEVSQARLLIDKVDLTAASQASANQFSWQPGYAIDVGPHQVQFSARRADGTHFTDKWSFCAVRDSGAQLEALNLLLPGDGSLCETPQVEVQPVGLASLRPTIGFQLPPGKKHRRFVLVVDGIDLTGQSVFQGSSLQWTPTYDLDRGVHSVTIISQATDNTYYYRNWNFEVR
ncbi:hypothetical protein IV102_35830 [bacterium]|nr:hypothetical protein [bacterium]